MIRFVYVDKDSILSATLNQVYITTNLLLLHITIHIYVDLPIHVSGAQLIRFSYATNRSRPQESGYMQATYKKRKHVKNIPFDTTACSNGDLLHTSDNYFETTVYIQQ